MLQQQTSQSKISNKLTSLMVQSVAENKMKEATYAFNEFKKIAPNTDKQTLYNISLLLLKVFISSDSFKNYDYHDFKNIFFIEHINENENSIRDINQCYRDIFGDQYITAAQNYVKERGGKFLFCTFDRIRDFKNKTWTERELEAIATTSLQEDIVPWLSSCPNHIEKAHVELPEFSKEYIKNIYTPSPIILQGTNFILQNFKSKHLNVIDNKRFTTDTPNNYSNRILIVGPSDVYGFGCADKWTICSILQRKLNSLGKNIKVENHGIHGSPHYMRLNYLTHLTIHPGDLVIFFGNLKLIEKSKAKIGLNEIHCSFNRPHQYGEIYSDVFHLCWRGQKVLAEKLYDHIFNKNITVEEENTGYSTKERENLKAGIKLLKNILYKRATQTCESKELKHYLKYLKQFKKNQNQKNGSITVNCNPFTLGHLSLVEYAAKKVDNLFIFVIEEDKSFFPYVDRFRLVQEGTAHLKNVTVLRGGKYVCTQITFPEYFCKENNPKITVDVSTDAWFFGEYISKSLNISTNFRGEEPNCPITRQYNKQMKKLLPSYGINVDIIKRIEKNGAPISATRVRKLIGDKKFDKIKTLVPITTYQYILDKYFK